MRHFASLIVAVTTAIACGPTERPPLDDAGPADMGTGDMTAPADDTGGEPEPEIVTVVVEPQQPDVVVDTTLPLNAAAFDADGEAIPSTFTWTSAAPDIAEVAASGIVIGRAVGTSVVTATTDGVSGSTEVRVVPTPASELIISPLQREMEVDDTVQISVELLDENGGLLDASTRDITFASSDEAVVTVSETGLVTAVGAGSAAVTVSADGLTAISDFTVTASELTRIDLTPTTLRLYPGDTRQLDVSFVWTEDPGVDPVVTWTSSDLDVATVTDGLVTAVTKGSATITAEAAGRTASADVDVVFDFGVVSAGDAHACGIVDGTVWCWGDNSAGQLGHASGPGPAPVQSTLSFKAVSAGGEHTCAIATDDRLYCWGGNSFGQLGIGSRQASSSPARVGTFDVRIVDASAEHTCAITTAGQAYCWGNGADGRLGGGTTDDELIPRSIGSFTGIATGARHTCATSNGVGGDCWGDNDSGQLGRNFSSDFEASPGAITGGYDFSEIVVGADHTCGVTIATSAACWGLNTSGQVGDGSNAVRVTPILLPGSPQLTRLTVGDAHSCGLSAIGAAYCWGEGDDGRLGTGTTTDQDGSTEVLGGLQFIMLSAGSNFTCGITLAGDPYCWGDGTMSPEPVF